MVGQVLQSDDARFAALREYYPQAKKEEWRLWQAGQRVQIIKRDPLLGGVLRLGTEVVSDRQGTIAALLGASPGASTAAPIMLELMKKVFTVEFASPAWQAKLKEMIPSFGTQLNGNVEATQRVLQQTSEVLGLTYEQPLVDNVAPAPKAQPQKQPQVEIEAVTDLV